MISTFLFVAILSASPAKGSPQVSIRDQHFQVELAVSPSEWARGLMFREKLGRREGMLFVGKVERTQSFWMKNTLIPLDIIYISRLKKIVSIVHRAIPRDESPRASTGPAQYVLEIPGGEAQKIGMRPGDLVIFKNLAIDNRSQ